VMRLTLESLISVEDLAREIRLTKESFIRWGLRGRRGVYLDIVEKNDVWYTSRPAFRRFLEACKAAESNQSPQPAA